MAFAGGIRVTIASCGGRWWWEAGKRGCGTGDALFGAATQVCSQQLEGGEVGVVDGVVAECPDRLLGEWWLLHNRRTPITEVAIGVAAVS